MIRKKIIVIIVILLVVLAVYEIVAYIPYLMMGPPFEVFGINNMDSKSHTINVQVHGPTNRLLINQTYNLGPSQTVSHPETGWKDAHEKDRLFPNGYYTFIITLDGNVTETYEGVMDTWSSASIYIDNYGKVFIGKVMG